MTGVSGSLRDVEAKRYIKASFAPGFFVLPVIIGTNFFDSTKLSLCK
jgi:hypothetical protein